MMRNLRISVLGLAALGLAGCLSYHPAQYPLQPGDQIIFTQRNRATEFRKKSGNDAYGTNAAVIITRPTLVQCE